MYKSRKCMYKQKCNNRKNFDMDQKRHVKFLINIEIFPINQFLIIHTISLFIHKCIICNLNKNKDYGAVCFQSTSPPTKIKFLK